MSELQLLSEAFHTKIRCDMLKCLDFTKKKKWKKGQLVQVGVGLEYSVSSEVCHSNMNFKVIIMMFMSAYVFTSAFNLWSGSSSVSSDGGTNVLPWKSSCNVNFNQNKHLLLVQNIFLSSWMIKFHSKFNNRQILSVDGGGRFLENSQF